MPQESFEKLCSKPRPYIQWNKGFRDSISVEKQVTATLYYLADKGRLRKVANSFGMGELTVSKIIMRVSFHFRKLFSCISLTKQHNHTELACLLKTNGKT